MPAVSPDGGCCGEQAKPPAGLPQASTGVASTGVASTGVASTGVASVLRALAVLGEAPEPEHAEVARILGLPSPPDAAEHTRVMLFECHPFASVHLGGKGMLGGEAAERVGGFFRALGAVPPAEPDHLVTLLGFYATLVDRQMAEDDPARGLLLFQARRALLAEHMVSWIPPFAVSVRRVGGTFYRRWAIMLIEALAAEVAAVGALDALDESLPPALPLALRDAPGALGDIAADDDVSVGGTKDDDLIDAVVVPVRSGMVLTRGDLVRGGAEAGLGVRVGERRFILRAMCDQDRLSTLAWLSMEARRWAEYHAELGTSFGGVAAWWRERAERTAAVLATAAGSRP